MINVVHLGIGPLGQKVVRYAVERGCFNIIGAVDPAPDKAGKDLGQLCGPESYDQVHIEGEPPIQSKITGGVNGDIATCAIILNAVRSVLKAAPGLKTMADIPSVAFFKEFQ